MHAFDILGDPVRRRLLELLADGERSAGSLTEAIQAEFGLSQPGVSQHLRVLRESGFAKVRREGTRWMYHSEPAALDEVDAWLARVRRQWQPAFDALATEVARGKKQRREAARGGAGSPGKEV